MIIWEKKYYVCIINLFQFFYKLIKLDYKIFPIHMLKNKIIPHYFHSSLTIKLHSWTLEPTSPVITYHAAKKMLR